MPAHPSLRAALLVALVALAALAPRFGDAACCYFAAQEKDIHQPGQKAFITWRPDEGIEAFTVQPRFEGNALDFGMVIPTPAQPKLDEMPRDFFTDLAIYTILLPLPEPIEIDLIPRPSAAAALGANGVEDRGGAEVRDLGVKVLEAGVVGSLDYKIITAEKAEGLYEWLKQNQYSYSGDEATLGFYVKKQWFFTVMKIDSRQMKRNPDGSYLGEVTPTRFTFASKECIYPLKITQISVKDKTDALLYVHAPAQLDLRGDWSWMHSYRVMYLSYILGCSADESEQRELEERNRWVAAKMLQARHFETTKLEWARKLGDSDLAVLEDPLRHYAQAGGGGLPPGATVLSKADLLRKVDEFNQDQLRPGSSDWAKVRRQQIEARFSPDQGVIAEIARPGGWLSRFMWYPNREAPAENVQGLARLKGHLQKGWWLTKIRKVIRKDEMTDDLVLVPVDAGREQEYVRIMPTSPP